MQKALLKYSRVRMSDRSGFSSLVLGSCLICLSISLVIAQQDSTVVIARPGQDAEISCAIAMNLTSGTEVAWIVNNMGPFGASALFNGALAGHTADVENGSIIVLDVATNDPRNDSEYKCILRSQVAKTITLNESVPTSLFVAGVPGVIPFAVVSVGMIDNNNITIILAWEEPFNNFDPIVNYSVSCSGDVTCPPNFTTTDNTTKDFVITNLTPMTNYIFSIVATNSIGSGERLVVTHTTTTDTPDVPMLVPGVRVDSIIINGNNITLTVYWEETFDNFDPINSYTVSCSGDVTCPPNFTTTDNFTRSYTISNLTPMTNYIFSVVATNSIGSGRAGTVMITTPVIDKVTGVTLSCTSVGLTNQCTVLWNPVVQRDLTSYDVYYNGVTIPVNGSITTLTFIAPKLPNGVINDTITVMVTAVNQFGRGPDSESATAIIIGSRATPRKVPSVTVNINTISINGNNVSLMLSWGEPFNNFDPIVSYTVSCSGDDPCPPNFTTTSRNYTITNLTPKTNYTFSVVATNSIGSGEAGKLVYATPAIDKVTGVQLTCKPVGVANQCNATWNLTMQVDITGYQVYYYGTIMNVDSSTTTLTFTAPSLPDGVHNGTIAVTVTAINKFGVGLPSDLVTAEIIASSVAGAVTILNAPNATNEPYSITVVCTIHPDSTADQCVVMAMADGRVTRTGTASIRNGIIVIVSVNGLDCEATYIVTAQGISNNETVVGPKYSTGNITTGLCALVTTTGADNESDDELSTETAVAISIVVTLIITLIVTTVIIYIIARHCYKHSIKKSANKQRGTENTFSVEEIKINNVVNVTVGANNSMTRTNAAAAENNVVTVIETAFSTSYAEVLDGDSAYTLTS